MVKSINPFAGIVLVDETITWRKSEMDFSNQLCLCRHQKDMKAKKHFLLKSLVVLASFSVAKEISKISIFFRCE